MQISALYQSWNGFSEALARLSCRVFGTVPTFQYDHVAVNILPGPSLDELIMSIAGSGRCLSSNRINGREVSLFELKTPFVFNTQAIHHLEVLTPKAGDTHFQEGWDHIEMVLPWDKSADSQFEQVIERQFPGITDIVTAASDISAKLSTPKAESVKEQLLNPSVTYRHATACIKVHPYSLLDVIASEC